MNTQEIEAGLKKIQVRYENMKFAVLIAMMLAILGTAFLRVIPLLGIATEFFAFLMAYYFWLRYFSSPCPKCGDRFTGLWGKSLFGFARPAKCQNCGLPASGGPQEKKRLEKK
jgi:hypothetical protein